MENHNTKLFGVLYIIGIVFASLGMSRYPVGDFLFYPLFTIGLIFLAAGLFLQMRLASDTIMDKQTPLECTDSSTAPNR